MNPVTSERNLTPTSIAPLSLSWGPVKDGSQIEHGQAPSTTSTSATSPGTWTLPLSSTARAITVASPGSSGVQEKVQLSRPFAPCQVSPSSTDASTAPISPPPPPSLAASAALPLIVIGWSTSTSPPSTGAAIVAAGAPAAGLLGAAARPPPPR